MHKLHENDDGFSVVEILLVLIIIILIGFVGWFIYHSDHKKTTPTPVVTSTTKKAASTKLAAQVSYFTISQWGVRAPYSGSLSLEDSVQASSTPETASFSSSQLDASDATCQSAGNYGGVVQRYASTDIVMNEDGTSSGQTPAQYFSANDISSSTYKQVGNYYYWYIHPQGICGSSQDSQNLQSQTDDAVKALVQNFQAIPS
jgi:hypothetical protein